MKISVVGTGYVGLTMGVVLAEIGHHVRCIDVDTEKIANLHKGIMPIYEPGLEEMAQRNAEGGRLKYSTDVDQAVEWADVVFSAVGTPPDKSFHADLTAVKQVAKSFGKNLNRYKIFVNKSTVPVGTGDVCREIITSQLVERGVDISFDVVSNPEFLREGTAVLDSLKPDRIVVGTDSEKAADLMRKLYLPILEKGSAYYVTDIKSSEIIKYASNTFLATKISYMNEIARFCELVGADVTAVAQGMGMDTRIGRRFLHAGIGYGGGCFPKDVAALMQTGHDVGYEFQIIKAVQSVNDVQKYQAFRKLQQALPDLRGKRVAIWGLSFKPKTDDVREAPALITIQELLKAGAEVCAYDPEAMQNAKMHFPDITYAEHAMEALADADALLLLTEWDEFRSVDFDDVKRRMRGSVVIDGRNVWQPADIRALGFTYYSIGRT